MENVKLFLNQTRRKFIEAFLYLGIGSTYYTEIEGERNEPCFSY